MNWLVSNLQLKILSIILAILLWFFVQGQDISETSIKYYLMFSNLPENHYIDNSSTSDISVWVRAPKNLLKRLTKNDLKVDLNLKNYREGRHIIEINENLLNLPRNVEIIKIQPAKIQIHLLKYAEKKVKVNAEYTGNRKIAIEPDYVKIKGERKSLSSVDSVNTENFSADKPGTFYINIKQPSENLKVEPEKVKIKVY